MKRTLSVPSSQNEEDSEGIKRRRTEPAKPRIKKIEIADKEIETNSPIIRKSSTEADQIVHVRDTICPLATEAFVATMKNLKIISWNVNGLKALVSSKLYILESLIANHNPDILCLQETKIQEQAITEYENLLPGYTSFWSCSTVKKGYSGTAVFLKNSTVSISGTTKQRSLVSMWNRKNVENSSTPPSTSYILTLQNISYDFEDVLKCFSGEGRTITIETDKFYLIACYVPNSGEGLNRLDFRIKEWDPHMIDYLCALNKKKPVILTGDLNVGHLDLDIHNPTAKHISKQAGLTPQERNSFTKILSETSSVDAFRYYYPNARGQFSYWSQRTFARPVNKGLRLDYFICSERMFPQRIATTEVEQCRTAVNYDTLPTPGVYDSYILPTDTVGCSDHCPIALVLKI